MELYGLSPEEMERRVVTVYERTLTTTVNDIEHIESQSYSGVAVVRISSSRTSNRHGGGAGDGHLPDPTAHPAARHFSAQRHQVRRLERAVLQLSLQSQTLSEQQIFDLGQNFIRTQLATVQGASIPLPFGGKFRQVMVDLNPDALYAKNLSPLEISNALNLQNLILPAGTAKIGTANTRSSSTAARAWWSSLTIFR